MSFTENPNIRRFNLKLPTYDFNSNTRLNSSHKRQNTTNKNTNVDIKQILKDDITQEILNNVDIPEEERDYILTMIDVTPDKYIDDLTYKINTIKKWYVNKRIIYNLIRFLYDRCKYVLSNQELKISIEAYLIQYGRKYKNHTRYNTKYCDDYKIKDFNHYNNQKSDGDYYVDNATKQLLKFKISIDYNLLGLFNKGNITHHKTKSFHKKRDTNHNSSSTNEVADNSNTSNTNNNNNTIDNDTKNGDINDIYDIYDNNAINTHNTDNTNDMNNTDNTKNTRTIKDSSSQKSKKNNTDSDNMNEHDSDSSEEFNQVENIYDIINLDDENNDIDNNMPDVNKTTIEKQEIDGGD
jgi:hypothetical protein